MKLSVIIPYWNPNGDPSMDALLQRAVRSALDSNPYEIIVVNDGSPNDPDLSSMPQVKYIRREHGMQGAARNTGLDNAGGHVIAFLDSDDYYYPGALTRCMEAMEAADADLLGFGHSVTTNGTGIDTVRECGKPQFTGPVTGDEFMRSNNLFGSACLFLISRKLIDDNGLRFRENVYIEDEDFATRLVFFSRRFIRTHYNVYAYYVHPGSTITTQTPDMLDLKARHMTGTIENLLSFLNAHLKEPHQGLERKIRTLAIDHLRRTLQRKDWRTALPAQTDALAKLGLYPLDAHTLPLKFRLFVLLSRSRTGLFMLHLIESIRK